VTTLRERLNALFERRPGLTYGAIAPFTTMARRTVEMIGCGDRVPRPENEAQLHGVLDQIDAGEILRTGGSAAIEITETAAPGRRRVQRTRGFYITDTVRRVRQVLDYCAEHAAVGVITAEFGAGKTESVSHWRKTAGREIEHVVFEFDEFSSRNVVDFIGALADMLEVGHPTGPQSGGQTFRAICALLQEHPSLLIFDQVECVFPRILQVMRQIWDRTRKTGTGIVLLASPMFMSRLHTGRMRDIGALTSRVGIWAALRGVQREEAVNILRQEGVKEIDDDAAELLFRAVGGSMRRLMAVADLLVAKHAGKLVTERTVAGVAENLWGLNLQGRGKAAVT